MLGVTASGPDLASAIANAYAAVEKIHFDGMHYRHDIGSKGLKRGLVQLSCVGDVAQMDRAVAS